MNERSPAKVLEQGLEQMSLETTAEARSQLLKYIDLLAKWNHTYNLTAVTNKQQMVIRHLLDSLSICRYIPYKKGGRILDVGSGPGLPGLPLAMVFPQLEFVLLDSRRKQIRFIIQAISQLGLDNVSVEQARVEAYQPDVLFDLVLSRAFSSMADFFAATARLCLPGGQLLAMKGRLPEYELKQLPPGCRVDTLDSINVPGLQAERHVVLLSQKSTANQV